MTGNLFKLFALLMLFVSCGGNQSKHPSRSIASIGERQETLIQEVDDKLDQIHVYQVIGQNHRILFDVQAKTTNRKNLYAGQVYLKLQAVKGQVDELEKEIVEIFQTLKTDRQSSSSDRKTKAITALIQNFSEKSSIHAYSVENLKKRLGLSLMPAISFLSKNEIAQEIIYLKSSRKFQVFEQNIEHLSFMLETKKGQTGTL